MTNVNLLTVDELTALAPELDLSAYDATTISGMITAASQNVSDYLEYTPIAEDIVDEVKEAGITTEGDLLIFPTKIPVQTVSSIALYKGTTSINLNLVVNGLNRFNIDYSGRSVRYPYHELSIQGSVVFTDFMNLRGRQFYTKMSYRAGFEVSQLPQTIKMATLLYFRDILQPSFNPRGATGISQGQISFQYERSSAYMGKSSFVKSAETMLGPYRNM